MQANIRIGDHVLVVTENQMHVGDDQHEVVGYITGQPGAPAKRVTLETENQAILLVKDFLAEEPDLNGPFADYFPHLMP